MIKRTILTLCFLLFSKISYAENLGEYFEIWTGNIKETWNNHQNFSVYVPINTWHNRWTYDREKIDEYNEFPLGLGLGISRYDENKNWHGLFAMGFKDSNSHLQTIFGYAFIKNWYYGENEDWRAGVGFATTLTQRHEYNMIPLPLPLPVAGVGYKNLSLQAAYVPGVRNHGNVLFTWIQAEF